MRIFICAEKICSRYSCHLIRSIVLSIVFLTTQSVWTQSKVDNALYATDFTIRTIDAISTSKLLNSPCKCFVEADPMAPGAKSPAVIFVYQAAFSLGTMTTSRMLEKHHHARLARLLVIADIISESYVAQHNMRMHEPYWNGQ